MGRGGRWEELGVGLAHLRDNSHLSKVAGTTALYKGHSSSQAQTIHMVAGNWPCDGGSLGYLTVILLTMWHTFIVQSIHYQ